MSAIILNRLMSNIHKMLITPLSIEGYQVSNNFIEKVKKTEWNPDNGSANRSQRDALAARGYYEAFLSLKFR